ncbi:MAG: hypothetical protein JKY19_13770, partial [Alcanivoracaceae bacterium]|nr:hypothetical protein [Alcanivoracaceae bacterium]
RSLANKGHINNNWIASSGQGGFDDHIYDYGVIKTNKDLMIPLYPVLFGGVTFPVVTTIDDLGQTLGFPYRVDGNVVSGTLYSEKRSVFDDLTVLNDTGPGSDRLISHYFDQTEGQSGGPLFFSHSPFIAAPAIGVMSISTTNYNFATAIDHRSIIDIRRWASEPPPNVIININSPQYLETFDWNQIANNTFNATANSNTRTAVASTINANLVWESDVNGVFATGTSATALEAKSKLRAGYHVLKLSIDTPQYSGQEQMQVFITGPEGAFTMPKRYCIINLKNNPNACNIPVSWQTTNSPNTIVYNNRSQRVFDAAPQGNNRLFNAKKNQNTEMVLYASTDKIYDIDKAVLSAKTPIGRLSRNQSICSLKPSPVDPVNLILRDAKATPPGCGVDLSWSNVKWSSPSIYYKKTGTSNWTHLYKIPCPLNGTACNGSINSDDIIPELVPARGIQFKLLQFNNVSSGQLSAAFSVSAHRYADIYDYDNGDITDFSGLGVGFPTNMVIDDRLSNKAVIGVAQHNHNFHSPAVYDGTVDIDTVQVKSADFAAGKKLLVKVFNMAGGLNVNMQLKCAGIIRDGVFEGQSGIFDFQTNPASPVVTDPVTGARTMSFAVTKTTRQLNSNIDCLYNRVVITRTAGTPSENLTYSVVVNDPANIVTPVLSSAGSVCSNNYCIRLLGNNFAENASVSVRENISGSATIATFSGNDIYNRGLLNGQDRLQFPIQNLSVQTKFRTSGLCFKVLSDAQVSNEKCFIRPNTAPQPSFMGKTISRYKAGVQDIEHTSYVVVGGGTKLKIMGNSWKKIAYSYNVSANTVLEFSFRSTQQQSEINGIGFIMNGASSVASSRVWQVYGTQSFGNQGFHNYSGNDWVTCRIPVGQSFTGQISHMVFMGDEDAHVGQSIAFRSPVLKEDIKQPTMGFSYDPIKSGHGLHLSQANNGAYLLYFYSYNANGEPEWYFTTPTFANNRLSGNLIKARYSNANNNTIQTIVGTISLDYSDLGVNNNTHCDGINRSMNLASFNWSIEGQSGSWCMQPVFVNNNQANIPLTHSGVWFEPASAGWGTSLQTRLVNNVYSAFAVVYYYDANGKARWSSALDSVGSLNSYNYSLLHTTGYARTTTGTPTNQGVGSFSLSFGSTNQASLNVTYPLSPGGSWIRSNVDILQLTR